MANIEVFIWFLFPLVGVLLRSIYLRLHRWRYSHRLGYSRVSLFDRLAFGTHERQHIGNMLLLLVSVTGLTGFYVTVAIRYTDTVAGITSNPLFIIGVILFFVIMERVFSRYGIE
jgi:hypothetical protein